MNKLFDIFTSDIIRGFDKQDQRVKLLTEESDFFLCKRDSLGAYIDSANKYNLLDNDLIARLRSKDISNFRGAKAECMLCWLLSEIGINNITPRPKGRKTKILELSFKYKDSIIYVEVKSPFVKRPPGCKGIVGDDTKALSIALENANRQFNKNVTNILYIAPELRTPVYKRDLVKAFIGEEAVIHRIGDENFTPTFLVNGAMAKHNPLRFTRVSAVVCAEEQIDTDYHMERKLLVLHNPFATNKLPEELFFSYPQLVVKGYEMKWTDE